MAGRTYTNGGPRNHGEGQKQMDRAFAGKGTGSNEEDYSSVDV